MNQNEEKHIGKKCGKKNCELILIKEKVEAPTSAYRGPKHKDVLVITNKNKKGFIPYFTILANPIVCDYCNKPGRKRRFNYLWPYVMHVRINHPLEDCPKIKQILERFRVNETRVLPYGGSFNTKGCLVK